MNIECSKECSREQWVGERIQEKVMISRGCDVRGLE